MNRNAAYYIEKLQLSLHPEGGYFREIYRSAEEIEKNGLPARYNGKRNFSTSIYHLLDGRQVSKFHRIKSDEIWHFYSGSSLSIYLIDQQGKLNTLRLGNDISKGEVFQAIIPNGVWFGAIIDDKDSFTLIGCTVAPGFDFNDFELAERSSMLKLFPEHTDIIEKLT